MGTTPAHPLDSDQRARLTQPSVTIMIPPCDGHPLNG